MHIKDRRMRRLLSILGLIIAIIALVVMFSFRDIWTYIVSAITMYLGLTTAVHFM